PAREQGIAGDGGQGLSRCLPGGRGDRAADRQRAQRRVPVPARRPQRRRGAPHRPDRLGGAVSRAAARAHGRGHRRRSLPPSELEDGAQDIGRLRDHDEQGARADRGPLPDRHARYRARRGRTSTKHRAFDGRVHRRLDPGATRPFRHAHTDQACAGLSGAYRERSRHAATDRGWPARLRSARFRALRLPAAGPRSVARRRRGAGGAQCRKRGCGGILPCRTDRLSRHLSTQRAGARAPWRRTRGRLPRFGPRYRRPGAGRGPCLCRRSMPMSFLQTLVAFLVALTILIFIHELGHYLVARLCGVKVLRFSIGFGRPLFTWRLGADREEWVVSAIPLGGYVKMLDEREEREEPIPAAELPRAFTRQSLPRRAAIVVAGPLANFLLAIMLYALLGWVGVEEPVPVVDTPPAQTAAASAGLASGDRILRIDGTGIQSWNDVRLRLLEPVIERREATVVVRRDDTERELVLDTSALAPGAAEKDFMSELGVRLAPGEVDVGAIVAGSAAEAAGLLPGDTLLAIDGHPIGRARDLIERVRANAGQTLELEVSRNGQPQRLAIVPAAVVEEASGETIGRIGAQLRDRIAMEKISHGPLESLAVGARQTWDMSIF